MPRSLPSPDIHPLARGDTPLHLHNSAQCPIEPRSPDACGRRSGTSKCVARNALGAGPASVERELSDRHVGTFDRSVVTRGARAPGDTLEPDSVFNVLSLRSKYSVSVGSVKTR